MKIILKILSLLIAVVIFTMIFKAVFLTPVWGDETASRKYEFFKTTSNNYNSVFIGTSRTYRGIIPSLFDSLTRYTLKTKSFNFGSPVFVGYKPYLLVNELLNYDNLRYIFIELNMLDGIENMHQYKVEDIYWTSMNYFYWQVFIDYYKQSSLIRYLYDMYCLTEPLVYSYFNLGLASYELDHLFYYKNDSIIVQKRNHGYRLSNNRVKAGPKMETAMSRIKSIKKYYRSISTKFSQEYREYLHFLNQMVHEASKHNIDIVFYSMPKTADKRSIFLYEYLKKNYKDAFFVDLSDYYANEVLYDLKYSSDKGHLNYEGAKLTTKKFAKIINNYYKERI